MNYQIVKAYSLEELAEKVSGFMEAGFIPTGGILETEENEIYVYCQAVYFKEAKTDKVLGLDCPPEIAIKFEKMYGD